MADRGRSNADSALIAALASGATVRDAAITARVGETTVYRRLREPEFRKQIGDARAELVAQAVARLAAASTDAVTTLTELLGSNAPPAVRLGAARSILELGLKLREHQELADRVAALEAQLAPGQEGPRRWAR